MLFSQVSYCIVELGIYHVETRTPNPPPVPLHPFANIPPPYFYDQMLVCVSAACAI